MWTVEPGYGRLVTGLTDPNSQSSLAKYRHDDRARQAFFQRSADSQGADWRRGARIKRMGVVG